MTKARKQLDTDILLAISAQLNINNILLLATANIANKDKKTCEAAIEHFTGVVAKLVTRSKEIDKCES